MTAKNVLTRGGFVGGALAADAHLAPQVGNALMAANGLALSPAGGSAPPADGRYGRRPLTASRTDGRASGETSAPGPCRSTFRYRHP